MADLVRARLKGVDYTMGRFWAKRLGATIVQSPTHNEDGTVRQATSADSGRRAKTRTTVDEASAAKKADTAEATEEKN